MKTVLSFDYEIFFGADSGSAGPTLIEPTDCLSRIAASRGVPLVFFVDVLWLLRLREEARSDATLRMEHLQVCRQLERLVRDGHELQLHLHSHWKDAVWTGSRWQFDMRRYRLHEFDDDAIAGMALEGARTLRSFAGNDRVNAFRAGGWCLQPFDRVSAPLRAAGIRIDSTVYAHGRQSGGPHQYDFTGAPEASCWRFDEDPLKPTDDGAWLEVPIASHPTGPALFWRMAAARVLRLPRHRPLGSGEAISPSKADLRKKLFGRTHSVVSMDGLKAGMLDSAWAAAQRRGQQDFVLIGHPKAQTRWSLDRLDTFLRQRTDARFVGLDSYLPLLALPRMRPAWYSAKASNDDSALPRSSSSRPVSR